MVPLRSHKPCRNAIPVHFTQHDQTDRRLTSAALIAQNENARSEPPRPRKGLRPRPRTIRTPQSIVLFQPGADAGTRKGIRMPGTSDPYAAFRLNLEQQRKRAKDLLRAVRAGD